MDWSLLNEKFFEEKIEQYLITNGGYVKGNTKSFDKKLALDTTTLLNFIKDTQPKNWEKFKNIYGNQSEERFINTFCKEVKQNGVVSILRKGFKDRGIEFKVCYFKPETTLNSDTVELYNKNILHCTRQLHYSIFNQNSIDMVLFLNGIPLICLELKENQKGQSIEDAKRQYQEDRNTPDTLFEFRNRVLVYFCVDLYNVCMTTHLEGKDTYFLPFNQGSNGCGNVGGAGNPIVEDGYCTEYLWKEVLTKDRLMEIIHKYVHLKVIKDDTGKVIKETLIFPRYHQLDVVTKLLADVKQNGSGKSYLIQHSAGSGKSNSIAWLSHRLAGLHDKNNQKIFNSIIVVTDRKVLDNQLQDTIYQFDHVLGVVQKIDDQKTSADLREAINNNVQIIISTIQKFPHIYKDVVATGKKFAIIVDEAHSSQTGISAQKLKQALSDKEQILEEYAKMEYNAEISLKDSEDLLLEELASHGQQPNLSLFGFTATPKAKTLQIFGTKQPNGTFKAFHIYSMRQAIEEGFILDVLQNYTTYKMYYKIVKNSVDNPNINTSKGMRVISKYETLHPTNISQKTNIMMNHFLEHTIHELNGKAKAMVVTQSRLHALKYFFEFKNYIKEHNCQGVDVLIAFSDTLTYNGEEYTEEKLNKTKDGKTIKEKQLPKIFASNEFNILIVAEKYQTGFDEPQLQTMFVDKKLNDIKAVQTLSRLNRTMKGKTNTFILDFVNTQEDIKEAFQPYYEATILDKDIDPNMVYTIKNELDRYQIYQTSEYEKLSKYIYAKTTPKDIQEKIAMCLKPALDRYNLKSIEEKETFRYKVALFIRTYSFVMQVCRMFDEDLQKFYMYIQILNRTFDRTSTDYISIADKIDLEYYKLIKQTEGSIKLDNQEGTVSNVTGNSVLKKDDKSPLSEIVEKINSKFGTDFTEQDKSFEQINSDFAKNQKIVDAVKKHDKSLYKSLYDKFFPDIIVARYEQNNRFFTDMISDSDRFDFIKENYEDILYEYLLGL